VGLSSAECVGFKSRTLLDFLRLLSSDDMACVLCLCGVEGIILGDEVRVKIESDKLNGVEGFWPGTEFK